MFEKVEQRVSFPDMEKQLMARWKEEETFQRSLDMRQGQKRFVFYEGPPTANGKPATHHILARAFKDLFGRYKTMKASTWNARRDGTHTAYPSRSRSRRS